MTTEKRNASGTQADQASGSASSQERARASDAYNAAREKTAAAFSGARERASGAYETARSSAAKAGERATEQIDRTPETAILGGLVVGAAVAALLPVSRRESELLGSVGAKINDTAREAVRAARDTGREKLDEMGFGREGASKRVSELVGATASAAASKVRQRPQ